MEKHNFRGIHYPKEQGSETENCRIRMVQQESDTCRGCTSKRASKGFTGFISPFPSRSMSLKAAMSLAQTATAQKIRRT